MGETLKQNKMGAMPVPRLLLNMGVPMMLSMVGQALYNMVDAFFVSRIADTAQVTEMGDKAINALTLAYPIQMLMIAVVTGIGIGTNSLLAQSLGKKDRQRASWIAGNAMMFCLCFFAVIFLFGLFGARAFICSQTRDPVVIDLGTTYLRIVAVFSLGAIGYMCLEKVVMGCGNTRATMIGQLSGVITNIILDPVMIFGFSMGVAGAAWATVIGQFVSLFVIAYVNFFRNRELDSGLKYLRPRKDTLKSIFHIGVPAIIMQILTPVMSYGLNLILGTISSYAVTAYGVYYKLQYFMFMAIFGMNNASIAAVAYNLGAKSKSRIYQIIKFAVIDAVVIMAAGILVLQLFAGPIVGIFSVAESSANMAVWALHVITWAFVFSGINIILQGVCQALGNGVYALAVALLRQLVIVLPLAYVFSRTAWAGALVWWAIPIAEVAACAVAVLLTWKLCKKRVAVL